MTTLATSYSDNDIWYYKNLDIPTDFNNRNYIKSINFSKITNPWLKMMTKEYILYLIKHKLTPSSISNKLNYIRHFNTFIETKHIETLKNFTHKDTIDFIHFLNTIRPTYNFLTRNLSTLSLFTQWGAWTHPEQFPSLPVVTSLDSPKIVHKEPKYYTENEIKKIKSLLPYIDKTMARLTLIMIYHGLRFSDLAITPILINGHSCLTQTSNHEYIFEYLMSKTKRFNRIPVSEAIAKLIQIQIESTKRKFGKNCNILFATKKNKGYNQYNYRAKINYYAKKYKLTYDNGQPLQINTTMFRSTYATKLINSGISPNTIRALLGHKTIATQNHYAVIHSKTMIELLTPLTKQDNNLIEHIGNITESMCHIPDDYSDFIPLPNGACTCVGNCTHQNACYTCNFYVPQKEFLPTYKLQLEQAELAIEEARKYNHTAFMEKNTSLRDTLKKIISSLEDNDYETG